MTIRLGTSDYGVTGVRLLRVTRQEGRHDVKETQYSIRFEGDFQAALSQGENRRILPPDTIKNTVYALSRQYPVESAEDFALHLIEHFLTYNRQVTVVHVEAVEDAWARIQQGGKPSAHSFVRSNAELRTARLTGESEETTVRAGVENLALLKTAKASFEGYLRDPYTTLKDVRDGILSASIRADWLYESGVSDFAPLWHGVRQALVESFAEHESRSLQHTMHMMAEAVLGNFDRIQEIHLELRQNAYDPVDLSPFGMDNPAEVFLPAEEPSGVAQVTLRREEAV